MLKRFILSLTLFSSLSMACGLHQSTGFNLVTEPGSLEVFGNVVAVRQIDMLGNLNKPDHFRLFALKAALAKPNSNKVEFSIFEAIKGHYSQVSFEEGVNVTGRKTLPTKEDLLVVTELDVLDALSTKRVTWQQANDAGLIVINGAPKEVEQLEAWFSDIF
ncbi:hypothetical protein [Vibrio maerlii]|uniref:hypothetical protein n=1 Tax=Vibrio maerlii TaxID=2231648 RepID=UPI000E3B822C|nr:hypothetical protein [Vibrio maerlii]